MAESSFLIGQTVSHYRIVDNIGAARCLEKDLRFRVQTARDVVNEIRELAVAVRTSSATATSNANFKNSRRAYRTGLRIAAAYGSAANPN